MNGNIYGDALADNSYLHSVSRCFERKANCENDILNFIRFIGEIISHRTICVSVKKNGPVFPKTEFIMNEINKSVIGLPIINCLDQKEIDYEILCQLASCNLSRGINYLINNIQTYKDQNPLFYKGQNPDYKLHEILIGNTKQNKSIEGEVMKKGIESVVYKTLKNGFLLEEIRGLVQQNPQWTVSNTEALAAIIRTEIYIELCQLNNLSYLPSIGRMKIINFKEKSNFLKMIFMNSQTEENPNLMNNSVLIRAIFANNGFNPEKVLDSALKLRHDTRNIKILSSNKKGDAAVLYKYRKIEPYKKIMESFIENNEQESIFSPFIPTIAYSPIKNEFSMSFFDVGRLFGLIGKRMIIKELNPYFIIIASFKLNNSISNTDDLSHLKQKCGLYE